MLGRPALRLAGAAALFLLAACTSAPPSETPTALKLYVGGAGVYRITRADLQTFNFSSDLAHLRLTHKGDDVPLDVDASGDALLFYASPALTPYSPTDVYWLTTSDMPARSGSTARVVMRAGMSLVVSQ